MKKSTISQNPALKIQPWLTIFLFFIYSISFGQIDKGKMNFNNDGLSSIDELQIQEVLKDYENLSENRSGFPPIWDPPTLTPGNPHGIVVTLESNPRINNEPLQLYDYIGGFFTDLDGSLKCGGAIYWPYTQGVVFSLIGDDPATPEKEGFSYAEQIYFKFFSDSTMKDYDVDELDFDPTYYSTDKWYPLGISSA